MSYNIYLKDPHTELHIGITYNYSKHYYRVIDEEEGIRYLYGMTGEESVPVLQDSIFQLMEDFHENYWEATEGNARLALEQMLSFALLAPYGVWTGD